MLSWIEQNQYFKVSDEGGFKLAVAKVQGKPIHVLSKGDGYLDYFLSEDLAKEAANNFTAHSQVT